MRTAKLAQNSEELLAQQSEPAALPQRAKVWWRALVATAVLALFALAGILIYLETDKGTLTIESAEDGVEITIKKADRVYEKLQLKQGANSLRIGAGKYEIEITGEHGALEIEDGVFTLKRGDDWIARISEKPRATDADTPQKGIAEKKVADPTFERKTFQEWLEQYRTERSINVQMDALRALKNLSDTEDQTRKAIRAIYQYYRPTIIGSYVDALSHWPRETVIDETKRVLASGSPEAQNLALQAAAQDTDPLVALAALRNLVREMEVKDDAIKQKLAEFMSAGDEKHVYMATMLMAKIDSANQPVLDKAKAWSESGDPSLEWKAVNIYVFCFFEGNESVIDTMLELLKDEDWGQNFLKADAQYIQCVRDHLISSLARGEIAEHERVLERLEKEVGQLKKKADDGKLWAYNTLEAISKMQEERNRKSREEKLREEKEER